MEIFKTLLEILSDYQGYVNSGALYGVIGALATAALVTVIVAIRYVRLKVFVGSYYRLNDQAGMWAGKAEALKEMWRERYGARSGTEAINPEENRGADSQASGRA